LEEAIDLVKKDTRRYAKRQLTWFRADHEVRWFHPSQKVEMLARLSDFFQADHDAERG
jgi:tRNA dimethylallyltransferase